ncbi:MAG: SprB repeat-containing protein [Flavobacteriales bacterium]|nr:SprB repeat-containing protein [Flavobacteriales bacterium]
MSKSPSNSLSTLNGIDYGFQVRLDGQIIIYELGLLGEIIPSYYDGDLLRIERKSDTIYYIINEDLIRTVATNPQDSLYIDVSFHTTGSKFEEVRYLFCELQVNYLVVDQSPQEFGSIVLTPLGGTAPYTYLWDDQTTLNIRENLVSGIYNVTITDAVNDTFDLEIIVGLEIEWSNGNGVSLQDNIIVKDGEEGWGTGAVTINNLYGINVDLRAEVTNSEKIWAFGYRDVTKTQAVSYSDLDFGFYVDDGNNLYCWNNDQLINVGQVNIDDILVIEKNEFDVVFKKNQTIVHQSGYNTSKHYDGDIIIASSRIHIPAVIIKVPLPFVTISAEIDHIPCYLLAHGGIDITASLSNSSSNFAYNWVGPNGFTSTTEDITFLERGVYTVTATLLPAFPPMIPYGMSYTKSFIIGYDLDWTDHVNVTDNFNDLAKNVPQGGQSTLAWDAGAASVNTLEVNTNGFTSFTLQDDYKDYPFIFTQTTSPIFIFGLSENNIDQTDLSIDYGIKINKAFYCCSGYNIYRNMSFDIIENGVIQDYTTGPSAGVSIEGIKCDIGDVFTIQRFFNSIIYFKNNQIIHVSPQNNLYSKNLIVDVSIFQGDEDVSGSSPVLKYQIFDANTSFRGCPLPEGIAGYGILKKKLDAGFYTTAGGNLWFKYEEDYFVNGSNLNLKIYDSARNEIVGIPVGTILKTGTNYYKLNVADIAGMPAGKYYTLEITNEKSETYLLRFLLL